MLARVGNFQAWKLSKTLVNIRTSERGAMKVRRKCPCFCKGLAGSAVWKRSTLSYICLIWTVKVTITIIQTELWDTDWGLSCYLSTLVRTLSSGQSTLRASTAPEQQRSQ